MDNVTNFTRLPERSKNGFAALPTESQVPRCLPSVVGDCTRILIGCFRSGDAADPEVYVTAVGAVLSRYPEDVVRQVTDPVRGLPGRSKWLPTVSEVREACEALMRPRVEAEARRKRFAETQALIEDKAGPTDAERRAAAVAHWEQEIRPKLAAKEDEHGVSMAPEAIKARAEERLVALKADADKPLVIGEGLAQKLAAMRSGG